MHASFLGIIEGITEFLPISSTAHLILASRLMQIPQTEALKTFEIAIQSGAIFAVLALYGKRLLRNKHVFYRVLASFIPTAALGLLLHKIVKDVFFESMDLILWSLFLGGAVLILLEMTHKEKNSDLSHIEKMSWQQAILIGVAQSLAMIPGVSRSGATIVAGLLLRMRREAIVEFTFLLAIPTLLAATGFDLVKSASLFTQEDVLMLITGFVMAFLTSLIAIQWLMQYIKKNTFIPFGVYRIAVAIMMFFVLF